jgi:hypothetical protein
MAHQTRWIVKSVGLLTTGTFHWMMWVTGLIPPACDWYSDGGCIMGPYRQFVQLQLTALAMQSISSCKSCDLYPQSTKTWTSHLFLPSVMSMINHIYLETPWNIPQTLCSNCNNDTQHTTYPWRWTSVAKFSLSPVNSNEVGLQDTVFGRHATTGRMIGNMYWQAGKTMNE